MKTETNQPIVKSSTLEQDSISFVFKDEPIIVINEGGFKYKGELIEDSGQVYKLFKQFLESTQIMQQEISDEEIEKEAKNHHNYYEWSAGAKWYREQLKLKQPKKD
jgi:hypothetical protein